MGSAGTCMCKMIYCNPPGRVAQRSTAQHAHHAQVSVHLRQVDEVVDHRRQRASADVHGPRDAEVREAHLRSALWHAGPAQRAQHGVTQQNTSRQAQGYFTYVRIHLHRLQHVSTDALLRWLLTSFEQGQLHALPGCQSAASACRQPGRRSHSSKRFSSRSSRSRLLVSSWPSARLTVCLTASICALCFASFPVFLSRACSATAAVSKGAAGAPAVSGSRSAGVAMVEWVCASTTAYKQAARRPDATIDPSV